MFPFLEGYFKKGGNTVFSLLLYVIYKELSYDAYNKICLFSYACGGQNKNYMLIVFLSLLSKKLQTEIQHLYPVKGHSYCQCDRNFGMYGQKKTMIEAIETEDDYIDLIRDARTPPFTIVKSSEYEVKAFEAEIEKKIYNSENTEN